jgi:hypothetical protein
VYQEAHGRQVLVLPGTEPPDQVTYSSTALTPKSGRRMKRHGKKDPGSVRVLLSNPRWERRLLRSLELSGVGVMDDVVDGEEALAASCGFPGKRRIGLRLGRQIDQPFPFLFPCTKLSLLRGTHTPESCAQRTAEGEGSLLLRLRPRAADRFLLL